MRDFVQSHFVPLYFLLIFGGGGLVGWLIYKSIRRYEGCVICCGELAKDSNWYCEMHLKLNREGR